MPNVLRPVNTPMQANIAGRAYVLEEGRIIATGSPAELLGQPHIRRAYLGESA
jgi:branched-chain amino acid transport system ATP-binding protein